MSIEITTTRAIFQVDIDKLCSQLGDVFSLYYAIPHSFVLQKDSIEYNQRILQMNFKKSHHDNNSTSSSIEFYPPTYSTILKLEGVDWKPADIYLIRACLTSIGISP